MKKTEWKVGVIVCNKCGHKQVSVRPVEVKDEYLECSNCRENVGKQKAGKEENKNVF